MCFLQFFKSRARNRKELHIIGHFAAVGVTSLYHHFSSCPQDASRFWLVDRHLPCIYYGRNSGLDGFEVAFERSDKFFASHRFRSVRAGRAVLPKDRPGQCDVWFAVVSSGHGSYASIYKISEPYRIWNRSFRQQLIPFLNTFCFSS